MCGIVGKVYREREHPVDRELIERMKRCIEHRGPDENGTLLQQPIGFGFQRLAIIDLATGQQPMVNEDGSVVIVFNGEIYNYRDLREQLIAAGHVFRTNSDTETILHGYEQWGTGVANQLRGMFAFAIYDFRHGTLYMARDRAGKKPLYYAKVSQGTEDEALIFASELKSLLCDPDMPRDVDNAAVNHYFAYQYVPQPHSIFRAARKLPAAHWLMYRQGVVTTERYWQVDYEPKHSMTEAQAVDETIARLDEAVKIRLVSEVPLGCFLSGGIDSTLVVAMMRRHITGTLRTFSIGFQEEKFNELPFARQAAERFETQHQEFIVEPDAVECLGMLAWHFDEPFADSSALPTYYLARMTRQHVTVALNGDGGDESFAGYQRYKGYRNIDKLAQVPRPLRQMAAPVLSALAGTNPKMRTLEWLNRQSLEGDESFYLVNMLFFHADHRRQLLTKEFQRTLRPAEFDSEAMTIAAMNFGNATELVDRMMQSDILTYLPGALLPKVDRMTMANSLEGRSPFLDHKLMEFAARLPVDIKFKDRSLKSILKQAMGHYFDDSFINRPKQGFGVPLAQWFRGPLKALTEDMLLGDTARKRGYLEPRYVRRLVEEHMDGTSNHQHRLWAMLMFEAWARTFLDRSDPTEGPLSLK